MGLKNVKDLFSLVTENYGPVTPLNQISGEPILEDNLLEQIGAPEKEIRPAQESALKAYQTLVYIVDRGKVLPRKINWPILPEKCQSETNEKNDFENNSALRRNEKIEL